MEYTKSNIFSAFASGMCLAALISSASSHHEIWGMIFVALFLLNGGYALKLLRNK